MLVFVALTMNEAATYKYATDSWQIVGMIKSGEQTLSID
jgi:hypothetical protein